MSLAEAPDFDRINDISPIALDTSVGIGRFRKVVPVQFSTQVRHGEFIFETVRVKRDEEFIEELRHRALPFERQLYKSSFRLTDELRHNIRPGGEVTFVVKRLGKYLVDVAVVSKEIREAVVDGEIVRSMVTGARVVLPEAQGCNIGPQLVVDTVLRYAKQGKPLDSANGRTRSFRVPRMYQKTRLFEDRIAPLKESYTLRERQELEVLLSPSELRRLDMDTGVYWGVYPPLKRDDFIPRKGDKAGWEVFDDMRALGIEPGGTDGIRYYTKTKQQVIDAIVASGGKGIEMVKPLGLRAISRLYLRLLTTLLVDHLSKNLASQ